MLRFVVLIFQKKYLKKFAQRRDVCHTEFKRTDDTGDTRNGLNANRFVKW